MNAAEFKRAFAVANDRTVDLSDVDDSVLHGCGLQGFEPVVATIKQLAKLIRWQAQQLNGDWDSEELTNLKSIFRHKVTMVG